MKKKHVYILIEFAGGVTTVVDIYSEREYAERKIVKLKKPRIEYPRIPRTYGIIKKSIKGVLSD